MSLAASAVKELCRPAPSSETVEYTTKDFVKTLDVSDDAYHVMTSTYHTHNPFQGIDKCLTEQIQYLTQVSTMQPHEGSVYGAEKVSLDPVYCSLFCWSHCCKMS